jgi:hypothetical protein
MEKKFGTFAQIMQHNFHFFERVREVFQCDAIFFVAYLFKDIHLKFKIITFCRSDRLNKSPSLCVSVIKYPSKIFFSSTYTFQYKKLFYELFLRQIFIYVLQLLQIYVCVYALSKFFNRQLGIS